MHGGHTNGTDQPYDTTNNRYRNRDRDPAYRGRPQALDSRNALERPFIAGRSSGYGLNATTSPIASGFSDLLAKELDDIHAKHSPLSSPVTPSQSQLQRYSEAGLIAMYASRTPSPQPAPGQHASSNATAINGSNYNAGYSNGAYHVGQQRLPNADSGYLDSTDSSSRAERVYRSDSHIQAAGQPSQYTPSASGSRERFYTAENSGRSSSQQSVPLASQSQYDHHVAQAARPSVDAYSISSQSSSGYGYFPNSQSGIAAPRPSTSSQYSWSGSLASSQSGEQSVARSSTSSGRNAAIHGRETRPLPAPVPEEEHLYLQGQSHAGNSGLHSMQPSRRAPLPPIASLPYQYGSQAQPEHVQQQAPEPRHRTQSEFAQSFYDSHSDGCQSVPAASSGYGISMANSSQRLPSVGGTANSHRARKVSQPVSNTSASSPMPGSNSGWLEDAMRRKASINSASASSRHRYKSPTSNMNSTQPDYARMTDSAVAESLQDLSNLPSQPPIHHSHSDPLYNARTPHSTPQRQNTYVASNQTSASAYVNSMRAANAAHHTSSASSTASAVTSPTPSIASVPASPNTFGQANSDSFLSHGSPASTHTSTSSYRTPAHSASMHSMSASSIIDGYPSAAKRHASSGAQSAHSFGRSSRTGGPAATSPPVLTSPTPSISVFPSLPETSFASAQSALSSSGHTTPVSIRQGSTRRQQKQDTLSPSLSVNNVKAAGGYFPNYTYSQSLSVRSASVRRDTAETQRQRFAAMGLNHFNPALLSNIANAVKDRVPRSVNIKAGIQFEDTFTGEQLVATVAELLPYAYAGDLRVALSICRLLHQPTFLYEVEGDDIILKDSSEQLLAFTGENTMSSYDYLLSSTDTGQNGPSRYSSAVPNFSSAEREELPTAVQTRFTSCYSPFCGINGTPSSYRCYSLYCPSGSSPLGLQRKESTISLSPTTEEPPAASDWSSTVSRELNESLGSMEVKRQNNIFELIKGEHDFKADLDTLDQAFREPLLTADPPIIHPARLEEFVGHVFGNLTELRSMVGKCVNAYVVRQREQSPVVQEIGDVILDLALEWGPVYMKYFECQVKGDYLVSREREGNPLFAEFMESRRAAFKIKHDFRNYHTRAQLRLPRLASMLLPEILKHTPPDHPDIPSLKRAIEIIKDQCAAGNALNASEALKLALSRYERLLERGSNWNNDLDLGHPNRQLFHHSKMFAKPEGPTSEWIEHQIMLFDDFLLITRPRGVSPQQTYRLRVKPIRLELLEIFGFAEPASIRATSRLEGVRNIIGREGPSSGFIEKEVYPISFRFSGRESGTLTLYVEGVRDRDKEKDHARREWQQKLTEAIAVRKAVLEANQVFTLNLLVDPDKRNPVTSGGAVPSLGKVTCSCPFTGPSAQELVAVGTTTGLWFGVRHRPGTLRQILQISVVACAVLQEFGMVLVQSEGRLLAYLLETLVQSSSSESAEGKGQQGPQKVSGNREINFFKVGRVGARTLVVYAKKEGVNGTVLKAMEPMAVIERARAQNSRFLGMGSKKTEWFRLHKDGGVPTEVTSLSFTRSKLALGTALGFEILDIETLKTGSFPDWIAIKSDTGKYDQRMANLQRRCQSANAISLFRISDSEFLFCYDSFAFFADRHGDPLPNRYGDIIEWEGRATAVVYYKPFVLAIDSHFVEIRDLSQRGQMVQLIRGNDVRCSYDGQGVGVSDLDVRLGGSHEVDDKKPHIVLREGKNDKIYELSPWRA